MKDQRTTNIIAIDLPRIARLWHFLRYNRYTLFAGIVWRPVTGDDGDSWIQSWRKYRLPWQTAWEVACVVYPFPNIEDRNNKPRTQVMETNKESTLHDHIDSDSEHRFVRRVRKWQQTGITPAHGKLLVHPTRKACAVDYGIKVRIFWKRDPRWAGASAFPHQYSHQYTLPTNSEVCNNNPKP